MRTSLIRLAIAMVVAIGAWFSWVEAKAAARKADATELLVTLKHADIDRELDAGVAATAAYWLGQYDQVNAESSQDAGESDVLLTAANAAFRSAHRAPAAGAAAVQQLDGVLNAYASALKAAPKNLDAAYNYEFVARYRDQLARSQGKGVKPAVPAAAMAGDLPNGPTIHGLPGAPPPDAKMEELQMLAPMEYGDREAQPEATPGGKRERKG